MAFVLPEPNANVYSIPDKECSLNDLPDADEMAPVTAGTIRGPAGSAGERPAHRRCREHGPD